jgi:hypothetical protein
VTMIKEMTHVIDAKDGVTTTLGAGMLLAPAWMDWFSAVYQWALAVGGFAIIVLTIYSKVLDIKIKRQTIEDHEG